MISYLIFCMIIGLQLSLLAQATDLLGGHVGRVGVSAVFLAAIAAYAYAILTVQAGYSAWCSVSFALGITTILGLALGWLLLHLEGNNFLLGTLAFQMGLLELANNLPVLGGPLGIRNIPSTLPLIVMPSIPDSASQGSLWLLIPGSVIVALILRQVVGRQTRLGQVIHWIRDDHISSRMFGFSPEKWRLATFVLHAVIAGVVGISVATVQGYISPRSFDLSMSITVLTVVYLSGTGGRPIVMYLGAGAMVALSEYLRSFSDIPVLVGPIQQIAVNGTLIFILCFWRRGLAGPVIEVGPSATRLE